MKLRLRLIGALLLSPWVALSSAAIHSQPTAAIPPGRALLRQASEPFLGDLPALRQRGEIRVLVSHSPTSLHLEGGTPKGLEYELLQHYEDFLNRDLPRGKPRTRVTFIPMPQEEILDALNAGRGDVAAAGLVVTPERMLKVAFTQSYVSGVRELIVQRRDADSPRNLQDLAGHRIDLVAGSSALEYLELQNRRHRLRGQPQIDVHVLNTHLVDEDVLELINAGLLEMTVAREHVAESWAKTLPNLVVRKDLILHDGGEVAWAVRKGDPLLQRSLNAYLSAKGQDTQFGRLLVRQYYGGPPTRTTASAVRGRKSLERLAPVFQRYAKRYDFDWLAIAALAYQESGLDQNKISPSGAQGIMQIMPGTAEVLGLSRDINDLEGNVRAGVKYLARLRDRYFKDPKLDPAARMNFLWAAYNAGPARIASLREKAEREGLDPQRWFGNVEKVAARELGRQTVDYVARVNKYYLAYRLRYDALAEREQARTQQMMAALPQSWRSQDNRGAATGQLD